MSTKWDDTSWQEEFLEMKAHKPEVVRLLMEGPRGFRDAWLCLGLNRSEDQSQTYYKGPDVQMKRLVKTQLLLVLETKGKRVKWSYLKDKFCSSKNVQ